MIEKKILVIDDDESMRWVIKKALEKEGYQADVSSNAEEGMKRLDKEKFPLVILDILMPGMSGLECLKEIRRRDAKSLAIVMTAQATMQNAIEAMKQGAFDYLTKPFDMEALNIIVSKAWRVLELNDELQVLKEEIREKFESVTVVGESAKMQEIFKTIGRIAERDVTVLLTGESGTGKEVIARALHYNSRRFGKPFIPVNLAAIPGNLLEPELFGHEKGAFTGAVAQKTGKFEQAHGGTIFLDEIGDLEKNLQTKLLRVLQEKEIERVGGSGPIPVDVRILAATNSNLEKRVKEGLFRDDLFFRLNVVPIHIPPLREHKEDIPLLLKFFMERGRKELGSQVTGYAEDTLNGLIDYDWPGNVRELENMVKRALVMTSGKNLTPDSFPSLIPDPSGAEQDLRKSFDLCIQNNLHEFVHRMIQADAEGILKQVMERIETPMLEMVLKEVGGNQIKASRILGINRNTLRKKIKAYDIHIRDHKSGRG